MDLRQQPAIGNINDAVADHHGRPACPSARTGRLQAELSNVKALTNNLLPIQAARHNSDVSAANTPSQPWIVESGQPNVAQDFTFDTPIGAMPTRQTRCPGRVIFSDVSPRRRRLCGDKAGRPAGPNGLRQRPGPLFPKEKALEFILFDLSSCVTPGNN